MVVKIADRYVRVFSYGEYWIDALFFIRDEKEVDKAIPVLTKAFEEFWEQSSECYGDMLEAALDVAGIVHKAFYIKTDERGEADAEENEFIGQEHRLILRDDKVYLKIGDYIPATDDEEAVIARQYYRQGMIYKNEDAYVNRPDEVCYIPELSDSEYTAKDFLDMCCEQKEFADELFNECDWQHPESLQEDWVRNGEWAFCENCKKFYDIGGEEIENCPVCGKEFD